MGNYSNPEIDKLQHEVGVTLDMEKRRELIRQALQLAKDDYAFITLHQQAVIWGVSKNVDVVQRADNRFELRWVQMK
jgi:peptide/nickel transport system substrate-binding protein